MSERQIARDGPEIRRIHAGIAAGAIEHNPTARDADVAFEPDIIDAALLGVPVDGPYSGKIMKCHVAIVSVGRILPAAVPHRGR